MSACSTIQIVAGSKVATWAYINHI